MPPRCVMGSVCGAKWPRPDRPHAPIVPKQDSAPTVTKEKKSTPTVTKETKSTQTDCSQFEDEQQIQIVELTAEVSALLQR